MCLANILSELPPAFLCCCVCVSQQVRVHPGVVHDGRARRGHRRALRVLGAGQGVQQVSERERDIEHGTEISALRDLRDFVLLLPAPCREFVATPRENPVFLLWSLPFIYPGI